MEIIINSLLFYNKIRITGEIIGWNRADKNPELQNEN
jgi:hypothetical protein